MAKIKILHAIGNLSMGGAEFQCLQLANNLDTDKYEVAIVYLHDGPNPDVKEHVRRYQVERGRYFDLLGLAKRVDAIVGDFQPDIIQAWLPEVVSVPAALSAHKRKIPLISGHRKTLHFVGDWNQLVRDRLRALQYLYADQIISNFEVRDEPTLFQWLYKKKAGMVIHNGYNLKQLRDLPSLKLEKPSEYRLIYAGRLAPQKGLMTAFEAMSLLVEEGHDVHLTLFGVGPKPYEHELKKKVQELNLDEYITFFGEYKRWQAYADDATALIFPTRGEGTSNVVLEALAVGLPVVISNISMAKELLSDGDNAAVVQTDKPSDWRSRIRGLMKDCGMQQRLSANGRELADRFSIRTMVEAYDAEYQKLLNG